MPSSGLFLLEEERKVQQSSEFGAEVGQRAHLGSEGGTVRGDD